MNISRIVLLVLVSLLLLCVTPGGAQSNGDDFGETCTGSPIDIEELEAQYDADATGIVGTINSPPNLDTDAVYLKTSATASGESDRFYITIFHTDLGSADNNIFINISSASMATELKNIEWAGESDSKLTLTDPSQNASFVLIDDSFEDNICLKISANNPQVPEYDWKFTISQNNENQWYPAPEANTATATDTETATATDTATATEAPTATAPKTATDETDREQEPSSSTPGETDRAAPTTAASAPGFGVVASLVAVLFVLLLSRLPQ